MTALSDARSSAVLTGYATCALDADPPLGLQRSSVLGDTIPQWNFVPDPDLKMDCALAGHQPSLRGCRTLVLPELETLNALLPNRSGVAGREHSPVSS